MINNIWFYMIVLSIIFGIINGNAKDITEGVINASIQSVQLCISFVGIWALWLGLMEIVQKSRLLDKLSRLLYPILKALFPDIPKGHPAFGAISLNMSANLLGIGNAATPFGIKAMKEMQKLNTSSEVASDSMCMFLVINTSSIQLIPTTIIALRHSLGSSNPTAIIITSIIATSVSTIVGIFFVLFFRRKETCRKGR
ncbi:MAG: nucleoside recognition domain-containing protein [Eubacteriaceae bacterium]